MHNQYSRFAFNTGDSPEFQQKVDENAKKLSDFLGEKQFMTGDNLVFSDFTIFELLEGMNWTSKGDTYQKYPNIKAYIDRIKDLPNFKEFWADDEKCIKRPFRLLHSKFIDADGST